MLKVLHGKYRQFEAFLCEVRDGMAACRPAGQGMQLSHNGAEGFNPLGIKLVEPVHVIISLVLGDLFRSVCRESTDRHEEFLDDIFHWDGHRKGDGLHHGQVNSLGQWAGLGQVGLPSHLW